MRAKVTTIINGDIISVIGKLSADNKKITDSRGMVLFISKNDKIELIPPKEREKSTILYCPFDMHKWFKASKQI